MSDIEVALKKETRIRKEEQLNSDAVHLGTNMVVAMAITECLANARSNLLSLIEASMYDPEIEEEDNECSSFREIDTMGGELLRHEGPNSKNCRDSAEHLDQVYVTKIKKCCDTALVSCEKILKKQKEEDVNVSICPKNEKTIASVSANRGVDEIDLPVSFEIRRESYIKKDVSMDSALTGTDSIVGQQKWGN